MIQLKKSMLAIGLNLAWVGVAFACVNPVEVPITQPLLQIGRQSVILKPGQTVRVPLLSTVSPSGDLTANGAFQPGDVTFTDGPACHLTAHRCSLWIHASRTSRDYTAVPVVVSESAVANTPLFLVSVVHPGEAIPQNIHLPPVAATPVTVGTEVGTGTVFSVKNSSAHPLTHVMAFGLPNGVTSSLCPTLLPGASCPLRLAVNHTPQPGHYVMSIQSDQGLLTDQVLSVVSPVLPVRKSVAPASMPAPQERSGNRVFYAIAEPHPGTLMMANEVVNGFTAATNGPAYQIVSLTNHGAAQPLSVTLTGPGAHSFVIDHTDADYETNQNCTDMAEIASGDSCLVVIKGKVGDPSQPPQTATLTLQGSQGNTATFTLTTTTYVYAAGGFNRLGNASVSGGDLLAECTAGTCSNALQGSTGNNYASTNFSVGSWINALAITSDGNLIVGGVFGAIGGATSGATSGRAALLAQCTPGGVTGNACINQINTGAISNPYAFNNAYIDAITVPFEISIDNFYIALGGISAIFEASQPLLVEECWPNVFIV